MYKQTKKSTSKGNFFGTNNTLKPQMQMSSDTEAGKKTIDTNVRYSNKFRNKHLNMIRNYKQPWNEVKSSPNKE